MSKLNSQISASKWLLLAKSVEDAKAAPNIVSVDTTNSIIPASVSSSSAASNSASGVVVSAVLGSIGASPFRSGKSRGSKSRSKGKNECTFSNVEPLPGMRVSPKISNQIWTHVENYVALSFASTSAAGQVFATTGVTLNTNVNDYTNLTGLFDQYRCVRGQCWLVPRIGPAQTSVTANTGLITSVVDYDDISTPTYNALLEYSNALTAPGVRGHYRDFKPHIALAAYSGAFTSYANEEDVWIDCASPGVQYFGVKYAFEQTDIIYVYDLIWRTTWEFRNQR